MTCEVAVMNRQGVALAADSAVTIREGEKIYHTAEKLFCLAQSTPVGIMTYGSADLIGVPWEIIVKMYSHHLAGRRFDALEQYANDFFRFIEGTAILVPQAAQREAFRSFVTAVWQELYLDPLEKQLAATAATRKPAARHATTILEDLIRKDHTKWQNDPAIDGLSETYGDQVVAAYRDIIAEVEKELLGSLKLSRQLRHGLADTVRYMHTKQCFGIDGGSGIVIAGLGDNDLFPIVIHYRVGTVAAGRLRYAKEGEWRVTADTDAWIRPFAQRKTVDMIIGGIAPDLHERLIEIIGQFPPGVAGKKRPKNAARKGIEKVRAAVEAEIQDKYAQPLMAAVAALPRGDLAMMAEALVSLAAFRARMSVTEKEYVGGPIDVAVLSKGDGFVWVHRKHRARN